MVASLRYWRDITRLDPSDLATLEAANQRWVYRPIHPYVRSFIPTPGHSILFRFIPFRFFFTVCTTFFRCILRVISSLFSTFIPHSIHSSLHSFSHPLFHPLFIKRTSLISSLHLYLLFVSNFLHSSSTIPYLLSLIACIHPFIHPSNYLL